VRANAAFYRREKTRKEKKEKKEKRENGKIAP
jgi:hypothetical protein